MDARLRQCSSWQRVTLREGWELAATPAGALPDASAVAGAALDWLPAQVPGTVASSLRAAGVWSLQSPARRFDAEDWWYRLRFAAAPCADAERVLLGFDGLATLAQVWLNGSLLLSSDNMFLQHRCEVGAQLRADNELLLCLRALDAHLKSARARPRWRTPMVAQQQLRWVRATLLGRTPGWSPPAAAVGPWREVWLERRGRFDVEDLVLQTQLDGQRGGVRLSAALQPLGGARLHSAVLQLQRAGQTHAAALSIEASSGALRLHGALELSHAARWWPHTHGEPALYDARLLLNHDAAGSAREGAAEPTSIDLGAVGFRTLRLAREAGAFALEVNGAPLFCRGACWMPLDVVSLQADAAGYEQAFEQVCRAGMNMLRVSGATVYEHDRFLDACDRHGVLLWQDLMFASMDYPAEEARFAASVRAEVAQQLRRLQGRAAPAILCGNSEVAQQAAMSGAPRELWSPPLFETELAALAREHCPEVPYCASSTHGGAFPHQASSGVTSYYGVGAYQRDLSDARRSRLRFASECLALANVPEAETLEELGGETLRVNQPRWKERVPRDMGAGWDFDDIRDHYLAQLFALEVQPLRYAQHERYLALSRVTSAEVMAAAFSEWRRADSSCRGALVWCLRDLWAGAGWGVIDAHGRPKAPWYALARVLQPLALSIGDEGVNGLALQLVNERDTPVAVRLEIALYRASAPVGERVEHSFELAPRSVRCVPATDLFDGFLDLSYAYRFGPPPFDVLHARLRPAEADAAIGGAERGASAHRSASALPVEAFYFPLGLPSGLEADVGLSASVLAATDGTDGADGVGGVASGGGGGGGDGGHGGGGGAGPWLLRIATRRFAAWVHIDAPGCVADDQYFHLAPGAARTIRLSLCEERGDGAGTSGVRRRVTVSALNAATACRVVL